jgi:hypothetical protein
MSRVCSWLVLAYLTLPRLNRILLTICVPDYFIGRTRTGAPHDADTTLGGPAEDQHNTHVRPREAERHDQEQRHRHSDCPPTPRGLMQGVPGPEARDCRMRNAWR